MAVYTELTDSEIREFLASYHLPALARAEGIRAGVENTNYLLHMQDGTRFILTLFEKRVAEADLPFFTGLMDHLSGQGVPCPMPIHAKDGQATGRLKDKPALIVTFLHGQSTTAIGPEHTSALGAHMARMHLAGRNYPGKRENALARKGWQMLTEKIGRQADKIVPGLATEIESELALQQSQWFHDLPHGVIHADLFPDNVFFDERRHVSGIIDFYFACNDAFAYEIAICLNAWCFEKNGEFNITKASTMLRGYHAVRPISEDELAALPMLARAAALRFLLTRTHDRVFPVEGALVTPKDPMEYLKKLRFHSGVTHHREYGL